MGDRCLGVRLRSCRHNLLLPGIRYDRTLRRATKLRAPGPALPLQRSAGRGENQREASALLTGTEVSHWFHQCDPKRFDRSEVPRKGNTVGSRGWNPRKKRPQRHSALAGPDRGLRFTVNPFRVGVAAGAVTIRGLPSRMRDYSKATPSGFRRRPERKESERYVRSRFAGPHSSSHPLCGMYALTGCLAHFFSGLPN